jgi:hypothetical protein
MAWRPTSPESLALLHSFRHEIADRGDERLALLLAGIELYAILGRDVELLEVMRAFAHEIEEAVQGTPTARELEELFNRKLPE